jgi:hypothetical protein
MLSLRTSLPPNPRKRTWFCPLTQLPALSIGMIQKRSLNAIPLFRIGIVGHISAVNPLSLISYPDLWAAFRFPGEWRATPRASCSSCRERWSAGRGSRTYCMVRSPGSCVVRWEFVFEGRRTRRRCRRRSRDLPPVSTSPSSWAGYRSVDVENSPSAMLRSVMRPRRSI